MYAISLLLQYVTLMHSFYMSKTLGPKIFMIYEMVSFANRKQ